MKSLPSLFFFSALIASASPALAFDCSKATTKIEKAICADANLKSADAEMTKVYADLRDASSPAERKMLSLSQRRWIDQRENACAYVDDTELVSCIYKETDERKLILQGAPKRAPAPPPHSSLYSCSKLARQKSMISITLSCALPIRKLPEKNCSMRIPKKFSTTHPWDPMGRR